MATDTQAAPPALATATLMKLLPHPPRLTTVDDPAHADGPSLERREDLFRRLVEREGPRTIAFEGDGVRGTVVDDYVRWGRGTLDEAVEAMKGMAYGPCHGPGHDSGAPDGDREFVRWTRARNEGRPSGERLRLAGVGGPLESSGAASPRAALTALHGHLAARVDADLLPCTAERLDRLLGADRRWTEPAALTDPARSVGRSADAMELRLLADDMEALLDAWPPHATEQGARDGRPGPGAGEDRDRARLYARTATGLLRRHYWMADASPDRTARLVGLRDQMTAADLLALAKRGPALVYARNRPLQRGRGAMRMSDLPLAWWSAGVMVGARLGGK
ncbi:erythromycin esterase family protein [Streptomyces alfalfae]|uniref:erythromycin esterase family protein n=1 Tax=Streptomyces alfalfae TaxID=1642299 RepID=UPI001BA8E475|nr:erythromycin esterase family protein [Streptomyces alfalfae]QUI30092.1 erythromycin esterase family protein [Streptomyces alfalfae]